ncbi:MAG TPA: peptidoglycan-binding domain-containing protein [Chthonomonadaceae bacterium]|nr:peptidoglycan-binding domain-containing protein [Chthonomonadaceae bacterium]
MSLTDDLSDQFFADIIDMSGRLQLDPTDMLSVMMAESNVKANAHNANSDASGLIQFLPSTLQHLGWTGTTAQFRLLDADDQLPYVERYFKPYVHFVLDSAARVYQVVFLPSSLSLGSSMDTIIVQQGGINSAAYPGNKGLDTNNDGAITVGELQQAVDRHHNSPRWTEIAARLNSASGGGAQSGADGADAGAADPISGGAGDGGAIDLTTQDGLADALAALGFDRQTFAFPDAVKAFQEQQGLSVDGIVGPHTRAALAAALTDSGIAFTQ